MYILIDSLDLLWTLLYKIENYLSEWLDIIELCAKRLLTSSLTMLPGRISTLETFPKSEVHVHESISLNYFHLHHSGWRIQFMECIWSLL